MKRNVLSDYDQWEADVIYQLEELLECNTSDAQGVIEASEFYLSQAWGNSLTPIQAAKYIEEKTRINN